MIPYGGRSRDQSVSCDHICGVRSFRSGFPAARNVSVLAEIAAGICVDQLDELLTRFDRDYGYGWYFALIWPPLYNAFASRS